MRTFKISVLGAFAVGIILVGCGFGDEDDVKEEKKYDPIGELTLTLKSDMAEYIEHLRVIITGELKNDTDSDIFVNAIPLPYITTDTLDFYRVHYRLKGAENWEKWKPSVFCIVSYHGELEFTIKPGESLSGLTFNFIDNKDKKNEVGEYEIKMVLKDMLGNYVTSNVLRFRINKAEGIDAHALTFLKENGLLSNISIGGGLLEKKNQKLEKMVEFAGVYRDSDYTIYAWHSLGKTYMRGTWEDEVGRKMDPDRETAIFYFSKVAYEGRKSFHWRDLAIFSMADCYFDLKQLDEATRCLTEVEKLTKKDSLLKAARELRDRIECSPVEMYIKKTEKRIKEADIKIERLLAEAQKLREDKVLDPQKREDRLKEIKEQIRVTEEAKERHKETLQKLYEKLENEPENGE